MKLAPTTLLRAGGAGAFAGLLFLGVGGRAAMRLVAMIIRQPPHLGPATLGILLIGVVLGLVAALVFILMPGALRRGRGWTGLAYGTALFVLLAMLLPRSVTAEIAAVPGPHWWVVPLFWAPCLAYALLLERLVREPARRLTLTD